MEKYSLEGKVNRIAAAAIKRGNICVLNENNKLALAGASDENKALFVAEWDVAEGETLAARIVGASAGTALCYVTQGALTAGAKVYLAANGELTITQGTVAVGFYLGKAETTTATSLREVALIV